MKLANLFAVTAAVTMLSGCIVVANPSHADTHSRQELQLDAGSLSELEVIAGAGKLDIRGQDGISEITVIADIYTDRKNRDNYELTLSKSGDVAKLIARNGDTSGFWVSNSPYIDIVVNVPSELLLQVKDGSGDMKVNGMRDEVTIEDGSGDMTVTNIIGNLTIEDGSGEMNLKDIQGNIAIDDGSGGIVAKNITGTANIEDGSGDLTVRGVSGVVTVDDGSGDIDIQNAGGLTIIESGSGGLHIKDVEGKLEIDS